MRKLSALALASVFLVIQALFGSFVPSPAAAPQSPDAPNRLRLDIQSMSPRLVTAEEDMLHISGTVTNIGDRRISDLVARLQFGPRQNSANELAAALVEPPPAEAATSDWSGVADTLEPGQQASLSLTVPLAGLGLATPGVYSMLINVNGTPAYGGPARLAAHHLLLPVVGPSSGSAEDPTPVSMLWPIAASEPEVVKAPHDGPIVLSDDELATELASGGRLDALVTAASAYRDDPEIFNSLCFAVDPDLLETVEAMSTGYQVRTPSGTMDGSGSADAAHWLAALRTLVSGHCVVQIPFARADLSALSRISSEADLVSASINNSAAVLNLLHLEPRPGVVWPGGAVDDTALQAAAEAGIATVISDPSQVGVNPETGMTEVADASTRLLPYDPLVADAFTESPSSSGVAGRADFTTQNGLAALAFRAGLGNRKITHPVLVAPPHDWNATSPELVTLLDTLAELHNRHALRPIPFDELLDADVHGRLMLNGTGAPDDAVAAMPGEVIATLSDIESTLADLQRAMSVDPTRQVEPISLIQPLHHAVLRATSKAWRSDAERKAAVSAAQAQLEALNNQVTVTTPAHPVALASGSSPLPVTLSNALPVAITVRIRLDNTAGLRPAQIHDTPLAANSRVGRLIPAEALRSGRFNVGVSLTTPGGTRLGAPARLELTSNEFGTVTVVLTVAAAVALALLSARRIYGRVKERKQHEQSA